MSSISKTILIVGATAGISEQFAGRFHALGKKVIITGRRADRLSSLKSEPGSKDITDFANISPRASQIITEHPDINSVFLVAGVGESFSFLDASSSTDSSILDECNTNMTAQMLLTRTFFPHLSTVATSGQPASLMLTGSGLGFVPVGMFPLHCATKAAVHSLALALRQQAYQASEASIKKNLSVVEVVAPFVDTDWAQKFAGVGPKPMPLKEYMNDTMAELAKVEEDGKRVKEAAAVSAKGRVELWRGSIGKYMNDIGLVC